MTGGTVVSEMTQEKALREADALVGEALKVAETRCAVLAQYISACESTGAHTAAWSESVRELSVLHGHRRALLRRRSLIQQALDCPVGEDPAKTPLPPPPSRSAARPQRQIQIRARSRS
jgi:hypothetical protein